MQDEASSAIMSTARRTALLAIGCQENTLTACRVAAAIGGGTSSRVEERSALRPTAVGISSATACERCISYSRYPTVDKSLRITPNDKVSGPGSGATPARQRPGCLQDIFAIGAWV